MKKVIVDDFQKETKYSQGSFGALNMNALGNIIN